MDVNNYDLNVLDWQSTPTVQRKIVSTQMVQVPCFTSLPNSDKTPMIFKIEPADTLIDLSRCLLHMKIQVTQKDGTDLPEDRNVSPCNYFAYAVFSSVELFINDQKVTLNQAGLYPWMINTLFYLHYSQSDKESLKPALYYKDSVVGLDIWQATSVNSARTERKTFITKSKKSEYSCRVLTNTMFSQRLLPPQTEVTFQFNRSEPALILHGDKQFEYKINILEASIFVPRIRLSEAALAQQISVLHNHGAIYPALQYDIRTRTIATQNLDWSIFNGRLPNRLYLWFVSEKAFNNDQQKYIFNLPCPDMNSFQVFLNDMPIPSNQAISTTETAIRAYEDTLRALNYKNLDLGYNPGEYKEGAFVYAIDCTSDNSCGADYCSPSGEGTLRVRINFKNKDDLPLVLFAMGEFSTTMKIDKNKEISWEHM